ncbi:MAG: hypothetical protein LAO78_25425 [Acidobacteriia bacterium]|nr:hypothetical protein [Terriglobia bacterium]
MTKPPNPITQGLRSVARDPVIFLVEILWRWSFALLACLLVFAVGVVLLGPLPIGDSWTTAWNSHDPRRIGGMVFIILSLLGMKAVIAAIAVPILIALLWSVLSALGRTITIKRLRAGVTSLRFRSIMALQFLRAFLTWFSVVLLMAAIVGEALIATRGPKPDLALYYLMVMPSVLLIGALWLVFNWYLSLAAVFGRGGQSFWAAFRHARQTVRLQRSDFAGTGFVFLLFRIVVLLVAVAICGLTSRMAGSAPQTYFTLVMVVSLAYFAISDFLYMSRMAAYLALAAAHVEPGGPKLVPSASSLPAENSSTL